MAESLSHWLALREPVDHASRSVALTRAVASAMPADRPLRIVDLGSGTGSNVRYLSPLLPSPQRWLVVDREPALMAQATASDASIGSRKMNLGEVDAALLAGAHLVPASAPLE